MVGLAPLREFWIVTADMISKFELPYSFQAPECFSGLFGGVTLKSDIWSFGVMLWELVCRKHPWEDEGWNEFQVRLADLCAHHGATPLCLPADPA